MAEEEKILSVGESHDTPQTITITIMDPSALEESTMVAAVEDNDDGSATSSLLVVAGEGGTPKSILQAVTETHMGKEELPIISSISNPDHEMTDYESGEPELKLSEAFIEGVSGGGDDAEEEELIEPVGQHCLICNLDMSSIEESDDQIPVFKTQTSTTNRRISIFLGTLIGQKLTSRKAHSDIMCRRCFSLLDRVDALEVEIRETKEEIVNKYQETVAVHGGRARRRKPATAKKTDYVFPKVEPEDEDDTLLGLETDGTFEPRLEDLLEEEHDHRDDINADDEEWEPEFKRSRIKREIMDIDTGTPPKRKRGRPRKDAIKPKAEAAAENPKKGDSGDDEVFGNPVCLVCNKSFHFYSQIRRHMRYEHPDCDTSEVDAKSSNSNQIEHQEEIHIVVEDDVGDGVLANMNLSCSWCEVEFEEEEPYNQHLDEHSSQAYKQYLDSFKDSTTCDESHKNENQAHEVKTETNIKIKCSFCKFKGENKVSLENHMDNCHERESRVCNLCNEVCQDATNLKTHLVHHYRGVMVCPVCPIRFSIRKHLLSHMENFHFNGYSIPCSDCSNKFSNYETYEAHLAHEHDRGGVRTCEVCDEKILALDFEEHLSIHEFEASKGKYRPHTCNLCQASFVFATQLYLHKNREHMSAFPFRCNECEGTFRTENLLVSHRWGHKYGCHQCPTCRLKYRQVDQLKRHLLTVHPELKGYNCNFCPTTLKNYTTYVAHLKFKHPKEAGYDKKPVRCKICGESFAHKVQWKYHMRNHSLSHHKCSFCGIFVKNLEVHMNLHTKEKKYECVECGAVYHNKASFHFHVKRVHMGEKVRKHMCSTCQKGFLTPADLRIHMSRVHYGERNYWCSTCNKRYKSKVSLTYHQRLHTGERPHRCNLCGRAFRVPSYLKRHMELDHRTQYTGVYYKHGRPKSQDDRNQALRQQQKVNIDETSGQIPEVVQITVPMEMGGEVISAISPHDLCKENNSDMEQGGVVYMVYEN